MRLEESRDAVIAVYLDMGIDHRISSEDIVGKKQVLATAFETEQRKKTGLEYEKSVFLEQFAEQPEVLKATKYYTVRLKCPKTNKMIVEQRTKVYDQKVGVHAFEEISGNTNSTHQIIDDGQVILQEGQQDQVFHDISRAQFDGKRLAGSLTMDDVELPSKRAKTDSASSRSPASKSPKPSAKDKDNGADSDDEDDEQTPMEKMLATETPKKKGRPKAKASAVAGDIAAPAAGTVSNSELYDIRDPCIFCVLSSYHFFMARSKRIPDVALATHKTKSPRSDEVSRFNSYVSLHRPIP